MDVIKVHNDGKEKYQSFKAWCDEYPEIEAGYGETFEKACDEYYENAEKYMLEAIRINNDIKSCRRILTDYKGDPI